MFIIQSLLLIITLITWLCTQETLCNIDLLARLVFGIDAMNTEIILLFGSVTMLTTAHKLITHYTLLE